MSRDANAHKTSWRPPRRRPRLATLDTTAIVSAALLTIAVLTARTTCANVPAQPGALPVPAAASPLSPVVGPSRAGCPVMEITVVYHAFVWPDNDWRYLISSQLTQLNATGLPLCAPIHVAVSTPAVHTNHTHAQLEALLQDARALVLSIVPPRRYGGRAGAVVWLMHENSFEFPGISLAWLLANEVPVSQACRHAFLYFHAKGMVFHGARQSRLVRELRLFERTIDEWRAIVALLTVRPDVTRLGQYPSRSPEGFLFHNFWWARASYLQTVEQPSRQLENRHYYEGWLRRSPLGGLKTLYKWKGVGREAPVTRSQLEEALANAGPCDVLDVTRWGDSHEDGEAAQSVDATGAAP